MVLQKRPGELYIHFIGTDKRMDEWVPEDSCTIRETLATAPETGSRKRKRGRFNDTATTEAPSMNGLFLQNSVAGPSAMGGEMRNIESDRVMKSFLAEEELDETQHKHLTAQRNFDSVIFDEWKIRPWYVTLLLI